MNDIFEVKLNTDELSENSLSILDNQPETSPSITTVDPEPLMSLDILKGWAGYPGEPVSDVEFLSHVGLVGDDIPSWFKQNASRWILDGQISQQEFVNALDYLVK